MRTRLQTWGNSLVLRIPKPFAAEMDLKSDSQVEISVSNGVLVVKPAVEPEITLESLLDRVTEQNVHPEVDFGPAVGKEVW